MIEFLYCDCLLGMKYAGMVMKSKLPTWSRRGLLKANPEIPEPCWISEL